jgi:hypothetical protein
VGGAQARKEKLAKIEALKAKEVFQTKASTATHTIDRVRGRVG